MPKRVTNGGAHLLGSAPGHHGSEETSQRSRAVCHTVSRLTGLVIESQIFRTVSVCFNSRKGFFFFFSFAIVTVI